MTPAQQAIQANAIALDEARKHLKQAVTEARAGGTTWAEVGAALGVRRQAAWERFSGGAR